MPVNKALGCRLGQGYHQWALEELGDKPPEPGLQGGTR